MDMLRQGMKGPSRPAPAVPGVMNRYSPVTNWNDDPFGADVFEPNPQYAQKRKPPPRPPPPKVNKVLDVPNKPSHFIRRPTVLTSLLSKKKADKSTIQNHTVTVPDVNNYSDPHRVFAKCDLKNVNTGTLIDLSSPPSSPTFTTRSSSDGLSVDSFGSDATTSTNHHNTFNCGSVSQGESGFEDDFDLFLHSRKLPRDDTLEEFPVADPFSPQPVTKPPLMKKPVVNSDLYDILGSGKVNNSVQLKGPTIIRAKPTRPKPPDNTSLLKSTFGNSIPVTSMSVNTTTPIQQVNYSAFGENFYDPKPLSWDDEGTSSRESSPPMPSIPPPPPPPIIDDEDSLSSLSLQPASDEPYAVALFDYSTGHPEDLTFSANTRIKLIRRENEEWLYGELDNGAQGLFPSNFVEIKVPLPGEEPSLPVIGSATALYDFAGDQPGDLPFVAGDKIVVTHKISDEWYHGECNGVKGNFPGNYVQMDSW